MFIAQVLSLCGVLSVFALLRRVRLALVPRGSVTPACNQTVMNAARYRKNRARSVIVFLFIRVRAQRRQSTTPRRSRGRENV
jgi:hypothetical protein